MSNLEPAPVEVACAASPSAGIEVLRPREVPLGGPRAMRVHRTLPQRQRSLIGAWCFIDHYGPASARMDVPPHPHTGLQTVSWLFSGEVEHNDSAGVHAAVRPGELNLMTAGAGICHSEVSVRSPAALHGVQLWVALPDSDRDTGRDFAHYAPEPVAAARCDGARVSRRAGRQPVPGAYLHSAAGRPDRSRRRRSPGHRGRPGIRARGALRSRRSPGRRGRLWRLPSWPTSAPAAPSLRLRNVGDGPARVLLLGGTPFTEELVMWWNFVGRSHDDIVSYRQLWEDGDERFGAVQGYRGSLTRLPAPPLPTARLRPRPVPQRKESTNDRR